MGIFITIAKQLTHTLHSFSLFNGYFTCVSSGLWTATT